MSIRIDGDYVEPENLPIHAHQFMPWNLAQPLALSSTFDLAMALEVAEHLSEESASIPHQGRTCHINEQRLSCWIQHLVARGYVVDALQERV